MEILKKRKSLRWKIVRMLLFGWLFPFLLLFLSMIYIVFSMINSQIERTMFVNTEILDAAGVAMPGADYTWEQFEADCRKIKDAGYTPIAAALGDIPHYWWEFAIFNHTTTENHLTIPESASDEIGQGWVAAMEDIKALYEAGYFPDNTLSAKDDETFAMFVEGKAAFLLDGSWKVNGISCFYPADQRTAAKGGCLL